MSSKLKPLTIVWSSRPKWPAVSSTSAEPLRIAVFDSSFDCPTKAHEAIASFEADKYDVHLLLLSSVNADKGSKGKPGHASLQQRTDMMTLLAKHMVKHGVVNDIAVATLAAANYADKAPIIFEYLETLKGRLSFYIGFDTVLRLFAKKYYNDSNEELERVMEDFLVKRDCDVVCIRRPDQTDHNNAGQSAEEHDFSSRSIVKRYVEAGKLKMADVPAAAGVSSTKVRELLRQTAQSSDERKMRAMLLPEIEEYCRKHKIYDQTTSDSAAKI